LTGIPALDAFRLPEIAGTQLVAYVLVLGRIGGLFVLAPVFSSKALPARAKLVAALALSLALAPVATDGRAVPTTPLGLTDALVREAGIGIAFALSFAALAAAVQAGAALIDTIVGFSFGSLVDPFSGISGGAFGQLYAMVASLVFLLAGGDRLMILGLARSYDLVPLGSFPEPSALGGLAVNALSSVPLIALETAGPVVLALLVTDAALGLVARTVPQMNVFVVGLPAKILLTFLVVGASLPFVGAQLTHDLRTSVEQSLRALSGG
jgi:flagellar biosynthetic protein FliR